MRGVALNLDIDRYLNRLVPSSKLHLLPKPVARFLGYRPAPAPPIGNVLVWWWAFIGAFSGLLVVEAVFHTERFQAEGVPLVIASLVRSILDSPGWAVRYNADMEPREPRLFSSTTRSTRPSPSRGMHYSAMSSLL
jgi:hypothetical protein